MICRLADASGAYTLADYVWSIESSMISKLLMHIVIFRRLSLLCKMLCFLEKVSVRMYLFQVCSGCYYHTIFSGCNWSPLSQSWFGSSALRTVGRLTLASQAAMQ
jgi:hypothetical protein